MKLRNIILSTVLLATFSACEDLFEPAKENNRGVEEMLTDPNYRGRPLFPLPSVPAQGAGRHRRS